MTVWHAVTSAVLVSYALNGGRLDHAVGVIANIVALAGLLFCFTATFRYLFLAAKEGVSPEYARKQVCAGLLLLPVFLIGFILMPIVVKNHIKKMRLLETENPNPGCGEKEIA